MAAPLTARSDGRRPRRATLLRPGIGLVLALGLTVLGGAPSASANTYFEFHNNQFGTCVRESGTTQTVFLGACDGNHSAEWTLPGLSIGPQGGKEMKNENSGKCLTVNGTQSAVVAVSCDGGQDQLWYNEFNEPGGGTIQVVSTRDCLTAGSSSNVHQATCEVVPDGDELWHFGT